MIAAVCQCHETYAGACPCPIHRPPVEALRVIYFNVSGSTCGTTCLSRAAPPPLTQDQLEEMLGSAPCRDDDGDREAERGWLHDHFRGLSRRHGAAAALALARPPRARREPRRRARGDCLPQRLRG